MRYFNCSIPLPPSIGSRGCSSCRSLFVFLAGTHDRYFHSNPSTLTHCCSVAWPIRHDLVPLFGYAISKQHSVCSSESFDNLLVPHFPLPACLQNNPDMGRSLPTVVVAVEPGGVTMCKVQGWGPRVRLVPRLDGRSSPSTATHTTLGPNFRTNHSPTHQHPQTSTQRSSRHHPQRTHCRSVEASTGCP